ncbi:ATP-binding cassette domain-containing protein [Cesiribacter sp. SM1]|uniref:ABC transporter ATP-binding protein n=1 Tax=Cesiribacter sp. SM1 TaxID=2861196 RepID=UPI001CD6E92B|nr:ABC transporter ATP-binding protein [Cesiribacter sp. SM1]
MVELQNINFRYKKNKPLFRELNLSLTSGYIYGLLGKNGAGKTTLLKHMSGLLYPQEGQARVFGHDVSKREPQMLDNVFVVPEEFELPAQSIDTFVKYNAVFYSRFSREQLDFYLQEFELDRNEKLSSMSYGQKKKFLIAFGLSTNARLLILDEPTNGLDIPSKSQFRKIMASSLDEEKIIVISTHQVRDLENLIDVVLVLENGRIIFNHGIGEISEKLRFEQDLRKAMPEDILYSEDAAGRKAGITKNTSGMESRVDLEILFNGVVKNQQAVEAHLTNPSDYVL